MRAIAINGHALPFDTAANAYRRGAAHIAWTALEAQLHAGINQLSIDLG